MKICGIMVAAAEEEVLAVTGRVNIDILIRLTLGVQLSTALPIKALLIMVSSILSILMV